MAFIIQRITVVRTRKPEFHSINDELQWFAGSLGLFNLRDKDRTCFRVFIELIKKSRTQDLISSDELAERLHLTRGTVVHHLNKLLEFGLIINNRNRYELRVKNLEALVDMIQEDFTKTCDELRKVARNLDTQLSLQ
ncbi:MAG: HTH domain-containing protein [Candidatus Woesearchaeota archaeon]